MTALALAGRPGAARYSQAPRACSSPPGRDGSSEKQTASGIPTTTPQRILRARLRTGKTVVIRVVGNWNPGGVPQSFLAKLCAEAASSSRAARGCGACSGAELWTRWARTTTAGRLPAPTRYGDKSRSTGAPCACVRWCTLLHARSQYRHDGGHRGRPGRALRLSLLLLLLLLRRPSIPVLHAVPTGLGSSPSASSAPPALSPRRIPSLASGARHCPAAAEWAWSPLGPPPLHDRRGPLPLLLRCGPNHHHKSPEYHLLDQSAGHSTSDSRSISGPTVYCAPSGALTPATRSPRALAQALVASPPGLSRFFGRC